MIGIPDLHERTPMLRFLGSTLTTADLYRTNGKGSLSLKDDRCSVKVTPTNETKGEQDTESQRDSEVKP